MIKNQFFYGVISFGMVFILYSFWTDDKISNDVLVTNRELQYEFTKLVHYCSKKEQVDKLSRSILPVIYCITPTYDRPVQIPELTRLSQALCLATNVHWIVVEDASQRSEAVIKFLKDIPCAIPYTHIYAQTPSSYKITKMHKWYQKPRGVAQRNEGLRWIRNNLNSTKSGVVFFMDDDNTYDVRLFEEMAKIKTVGVWPVGLVGGLIVEKPLVNSAGRVDGFNSKWQPQRPFPIDMAGFGINVTLVLQNPQANFRYNSEPGYQESEILVHFTKPEDLEPLADNCTKVYVWHTRTEKPKLT